MNCQICLRDFSTLRFNTGRIKICHFCVEDLNSYHEVAESAYDAFKNRLEKGIIKRLTFEMSCKDDRELQLKAMKEYNNLEDVVTNALSTWLNKRAGEKDGRSKQHKIIRAHRRKLLYLDRPKSRDFPKNWESIAKRIRKIDKHQCVDCGDSDKELHVHHIVYRSNFGTNAKENLVSICKSCHEKEHGRELHYTDANYAGPSIPESFPSSTFSMSPRQSTAPVMPMFKHTDEFPISLKREVAAKEEVKSQAPEFQPPRTLMSSPHKVRLATNTDSETVRPYVENRKPPNETRSLFRMWEVLKDFLRL